jgi:CpeT protein
MTTEKSLDRSIDLSENAKLLARWMSADFSNQKQAVENPIEFSYIHVFFRPLPYEFFNGIGFYSEQAHDYDLWNPYRQGIHRLVDRGDDIYIENYRLNDPMLYAGAARELSILKSIEPAAIERRQNCSMVFTRDGDRFIGRVEPGNCCYIPRGDKLTYLVSHVEVTENTWQSLDRGMDCANGSLVWGSEHGALKFEKARSFAEELPFT